MKSPRTVGRYLAIEPPGSNVTSSPRACSASSGPATVVGPDPRAAAALRSAEPGVRADQRHPPASPAPAAAAPASFFSSTIARVALRRMTARVSASSAVTSAVPVDAGARPRAERQQPGDGGVEVVPR